MAQAVVPKANAADSSRAFRRLVSRSRRRKKKRDRSGGQQAGRQLLEDPGEQNLIADRPACRVDEGKNRNVQRS